MTTKIATAITKRRKVILKITETITRDVTDVIAETIVTITVYGVTMAALNLFAHPYFLTVVPGLYSLAMCAAWGIRFVRHFDDSATNNELRDQIDERFAELQNEVTELKNAVIRNVVM